MKITIAKTAGFCMGVRRAVEMALDAPGIHAKPIYTLGPLIHNPQVLSLFEEKGIRVINDIPEKGEGTVIIRAHGVPPERKEALKAAGFNVIDATCPRVIRVQTIIRVHARKGYDVIILGDENHPEVIGLLGHTTPGKGHVAANLAQLREIPAFDKAIIVAQTTQNTLAYEQIKDWAGTHHPQYKIFETICGSTEKRQGEVRSLAQNMDAVVVVGGKSSGNTRRLSEIVRQAGKPAFHIETEADLASVAIGTPQNVGLTAGASTPNWIIRRVYRALEKIPLEHDNPLNRWTFSLQRFLLLTNLYVAFGAGCLSYTCLQLQNNHNPFPLIWISILYVLSMHILNHLTGKAEDRYNDPERAAFYEKNKPYLTTLAIVAGAAGLVAAFFTGTFPFIALIIMSAFGLSYNLRIFPRGEKENKRYSRLRDISGSKTILIALAWGTVTALLPGLADPHGFSSRSLLVFAWSTAVVFSRTAFFDILDMQGDRIVGKETIAILLGEKRSIRLLKAISIGMVVLSAGASAAQIVPSLGYALILCPVFIYGILFIHENGYMLPGTRMEFLAETVFVVSGLTTLIWSTVI
ncbi:MAG: 4-hydroxy-3-methylbut-2-enyl diphosphate reductase [Desulfobacteraceae bacterium]|nr:4-hydroxy-3-methylbut-2-enyl diphosphate reductase [Desulfobacteraceae bacterium]